MNPLNLKGLSLEELRSFSESLGEKKFRGAQLYGWLYAKGVQGFEEMTDVSKEFRQILQEKARIFNLQQNVISTSRDGTTKFLFGLEDGLAVESVLIPPDADSPGADKRLTLCVSTQVGCPLDCKFCATGTMGFKRNLTAGEIVDQVLQAQRNSTRRITNLVFMGMGEPMLNYDQVFKSVDIINDDHGLNIGAKHITISTAGYADRIRQMADERRKVRLALSLHTLDNEKRSMLMPINKKFGVNELLDALEYYYQRTKQRPTFEYIMLDGFNDTPEDLKRIVRVSKRIPCKMNLIPFHSISFTNPEGFAATLKPTSADRIRKFADALYEEGVTTIVRNSSGNDINAACGQLAVSTRQVKAE